MHWILRRLFYIKPGLSDEGLQLADQFASRYAKDIQDDTQAGELAKFVIGKILDGQYDREDAERAFEEYRRDQYHQNG